MPQGVCRACESRQVAPVLDLGKMVLAGGFLADTQAIATEKKYPLLIESCKSCGLLQISDPIDADILFQDYSFSSSTVPPLVTHFSSYAQWLQRRFQPRQVVEFGCNDGVLLAPLEKLGISAIGVDISRNITDIARENGLKALTGYFDSDCAARIVSEFGRADVVTGSNAFAHNDDPGAILKAAKTVLKPTGSLCLEVMYAGDLLELLQWDTLYHEHLTFYSLENLQKLLNRHGFHINHAERIPMHGGSLRISATMNESATVSSDVRAILDHEAKLKLNEFNTWVEFGKKSLRKIEVVKNIMGAVSKTKEIWGYGAAGKATMWVNACGMTYLAGMVDASPLRAGKMMPGTHTPIVFPEELRKASPDIIFVTAWNYADLIRTKETWFKGTWATPLPDLRFF